MKGIINVIIKHKGLSKTLQWWIIEDAEHLAIGVNNMGELKFKLMHEESKSGKRISNDEYGPKSQREFEKLFES